MTNYQIVIAYAGTPHQTVEVWTDLDAQQTEGINLITKPYKGQLMAAFKWQEEANAYIHSLPDAQLQAVWADDTRQ